MKQGENHVSDPTEPLMELFEDTSALKGPPKATLAKRAKSYSNFYETAVHYLGRGTEKIRELGVLEATESLEVEACFEKTFQSYEEELLDASQQEFQYVRRTVFFSTS